MKPMTHTLPRMTGALLGLLLCTLVSFNASAQSNADWSGAWNGALTTPGGTLRLVVDIAVDDTDGMTGTMESIDQAPGQKIPLSSIAVDNGVLTFAIEQIGARYEGQWNSDTASFEGEFFQGMQFELNFSRGGGDTAELAAPNRPQYPTEPLPYIVEDVTIPNPDAPGVSLAGTLTRPDTNESHPLVILISGSGPQDRNQDVFGQRTFLVLADHLTRSGVAVLRYDDRGTAESTGDFSTATSADFTSDTLAIVDYLAARSDMNLSGIGLVGHSEGGLIAPIAAGQSDSVDFVVLLAGPGVPSRELILTQSRRFATFRGADEDTLDRIIEIQTRLAEITIADTSTETARAELEAFLTADLMTSVGDDPANREAAIASVLRPWYRYFLRHDPAPYLTALDIPVLVLNGSLDMQVEAADNLAGMREHLAGTPDTTIMELEGLNHMFQTAETGSMLEYAQIEETFAPSALMLISDWIGARY
jgi:pimeloyl-ACP methyl ester carboxylesterase